MALSKTSKWLGTISTILVLGFGTTIVAVKDRLIDIWGLPPRVEVLEHNDSIQGARLHFNEHRWEMSWEFDKVLIDNLDSTKLYEIADDYGRVYEADIRWTGDGYPQVFVGKPAYITYGGRQDDIDRWFIVMNSEFGERQNYYLYEKSN